MLYDSVYHRIKLDNMSTKRRRGGKSGARHNENNNLYARPLPVLLDFQRVRSSYAGRCTTSFLGPFGLSTIRIETSHVEGVLNAPTRSVWVMDSANAMLLWRRGFFGKGSLSRSEPSWYTREVNKRKAKAAGSKPVLIFLIGSR